MKLFAVAFLVLLAASARARIIAADLGMFALKRPAGGTVDDPWAAPWTAGRDPVDAHSIVEVFFVGRKKGSHQMRISALQVEKGTFGDAVDIAVHILFDFPPFSTDRSFNGVLVKDPLELRHELRRPEIGQPPKQSPEEIGIVRARTRLNGIQ